MEITQTIQVVKKDNDNPKKIPEAIFYVLEFYFKLIETKNNIEELVIKNTAEKVIKSLQEAFNKYKLMEMQLTKQKAQMNLKIPEIEKALEIIKFLRMDHQNDIQMDFLLSDTVWSKGKINKDIKTVNLWLGANTMVEFSFEEAITLLTNNLETAKENLNAFTKDLSFLQDQVTTIEVNIARVYNANVKLSQEGKIKKQ